MSVIYKKLRKFLKEKDMKKSCVKRLVSAQHPSLRWGGGMDVKSIRTVRQTQCTTITPSVRACFIGRAKSTTAENSPIGQRYIHHKERGSKVLMVCPWV